MDKPFEGPEARRHGCPRAPQNRRRLPRFSNLVASRPGWSVGHCGGGTERHPANLTRPTQSSSRLGRQGPRYCDCIKDAENGFRDENRRPGPEDKVQWPLSTLCRPGRAVGHRSRASGAVAQQGSLQVLHSHRGWDLDAQDFHLGLAPPRGACGRGKAARSRGPRVFCGRQLGLTFHCGGVPTRPGIRPSIQAPDAQNSMRSWPSHIIRKAKAAKSSTGETRGQRLPLCDSVAPCSSWPFTQVRNDHEHGNVWTCFALCVPGTRGMKSFTLEVDRSRVSRRRPLAQPNVNQHRPRAKRACLS